MVALPWDDRADFDNAERGLIGYARLAGGVDQLVAKAREFLEEGDVRFAAELGSHAVFADPTSTDALDVLADTLTQLGFGSECATWRNCFLMGAHELHHGIA